MAPAMDLQAYPFPSQRMPVLAENGAVATSQPLAAQAGLAVLRRGGNAVDAAIATAVTLTVVEPTSNGIGGDAFALIWDGQRLHGLNASGRAPALLSAGELRAQGVQKMPYAGWLPVTVPGAPQGWGDLHARFGHLPFADLLADAIAYAEQGHAVSPIVAQAWGRAFEHFPAYHDAALAGWPPTFAPAGRAPLAGEHWASPDHARTLRALTTKGVRDFYEGEIAERIIRFAETTGGLLRAGDLAAHQSEWVEPICTRYRGHEVWEIPPNGQGLTALIALSILEGLPLPSLPYAGEESVHLQLEAMKLAFADAFYHIADPQHTPVPVAGLLHPDYIAARRALIGPSARVPDRGAPASGGTVYLCTADRNGMMVSYIQSNYMGFGSGVVVPGTGIALQNRGACFSLEPGHPNEAAGRKRPYHTIIPAFLTRDGRPIGPFGVMGGFMQPQGHVQVVVGSLDYGLNPQAVLDASRWQAAGGLRVRLEPGFPQALEHALAARGHEVEVSHDRSLFGRGQIIWRLDSGTLVAASDMRADGAAMGW
jgi:gamma-glutamyltranspeptidase/glutathione hydrolase